jgi:hypothetical protein
MRKLPALESLGRSEGTNSTRPSTNFLRVLPPTNGPQPNEQPRMTAAKEATERLFRLLPTSEIGEEFMATTVQTFMEYPPDIMMQAAMTIPRKNSYPTLKYIADTCDQIYEPIRRNEEREQLARERKLQLPPPRPARTAEQLARAAEQAAEIRKLHGIPEGGMVKRQQAPPSSYDGKHISRIAADLAARKAGNDARQEQGRAFSFDGGTATENQMLTALGRVFSPNIQSPANQ